MRVKIEGTRRPTAPLFAQQVIVQMSVLHIRHARQVTWLSMLACCSAILGSACLTSQSTADEATVYHPLEGADTSSPRATLSSFLDACKDAHDIAMEPGYERGRSMRVRHAAYRAIRCLDLSGVPPTIEENVSSTAAVCLKEILDRIELPSDIPDKNQVEADEIDRWTIARTEITLVRMKEGPRAGEFLFSADTVAEVPTYYDRVKHLPYQNRENVTADFLDFYLCEPGWMIPGWLIHSVPFLDSTRLHGQALWQWILLVLSIIVASLAMWFIYKVGRRQARVRRQQHVIGYFITLWFAFAAMLIPLLLKYFVEQQIRIAGTPLHVMMFLLEGVFVIAAIVVLIGAGSRVAELIISNPKINPRGLDAQFIRLCCRVSSIVAATAVFLAGGQNMGVPLATLLAGAGVGGLAVALAAQDTLKNVFGSMMIILDRPYRVGERIVTKTYDGVVEEIGLRSTKIRLLTGHQVSIPNEDMARSDIENIGRRPHIRRKSDIAIPLDTPPEKAQRAVEIIREILKDHEGQKEDYPPRVFLNDFNRDSLNIRMIYWFHPPNYWDFLAFSQKVNVEIMERFAAEEIAFALPTSATIMSQDEERPLTLNMVQDKPADPASSE